MTLRLQNTLSRKLEPLVPLKPGKIAMYVCGPTVYDDPHLGHLRSAFAFEIVRRVLDAEYGAPNVTFVRNVTDIDDKIIQRAAERGIDWKTIATTYHDAYLKDTARLGVRPPTHEPKATEHLEGMFAIIRTLIEKGFAYADAGSVYFDVRKFKPYGELSHQKVDEMLDNWRGEPGDGKKDALDFALWKRTKAGEPFWESPWGPGRPGWHIECSAMSARFCGTEFDIHGGGKDLVFPHHENERAQSTACFGGRFAHNWIHHGLVTIEGRKMSKSLGNFLTLDAFLEKYPVEVLKLFFLQSHYSQDVDFTWEKMSAAQEALGRFYQFFETIDQLNAEDNSISTEKGFPELSEIENKFCEALKNDFNTPIGLSYLFTLLSQGYVLIDPKRSEKVHGNDKSEDFRRAVLYKKLIFRCGMILGLFESYGMEDWKSLAGEFSEVFHNARVNKQYAISDRLRKELIELNLKIENRPDKTIVYGFWKLTNKDVWPKLVNLAASCK